MKEQFIPYKQALELKELGFDEECFRYKDNISNVFNEKNWFNWNQVEKFVSIPLWQQAFDFFREKYYLYADIHKVGDMYSFQIEWINIPEKFFELQYISKYEHIKLECLKKLIEIVKNK